MQIVPSTSRGATASLFLPRRETERPLNTGKLAKGGRLGVKGCRSDYAGSTSGVPDIDPMQARRTEVTISVSTFPPAHRRIL
jgi:hypothetical protein